MTELDGLSEHRPDVLVIGSGPAGLVTALELARCGVDVTVLESGLDSFSREQQALADAEFVSPELHHSMTVAVRRAFGGTSLLWGGRCVPFDEIDFAPRSFLPASGWPIDHGAVAPWYATAARYLDCGRPVFAIPHAGAEMAGDCRLDTLERWGNTRTLRRLHARALEQEGRLRIFLGATVVQIGVASAGEPLRSVTVARPDGRLVQLQARAYVIACGGLETTRLLLTAQTAHPRIFGGGDGPLGRYYMTHLSGKIADIIFAEPGLDAALDFFIDRGRYVRRRITIAAVAQRAAGVLNMAAWPDNPPLNDPAHASAILSLAYLALATPPLGRRLVAEAIRRTYVGQGQARLAMHLLNLFRGLPAAVAFAARFLGARYAKTRLPGFFVRNAAHRYSLHYHAEQAPNPASRIELSAARDRLGLQRLLVDVRYSGIDAQSVVRNHELIDRWLRQTGRGRLLFRVPQEAREAAVLAAAGGGSHQIGTTRMSLNARDGITDPDCRVHGIPNLFIASSSVFPTSGQANPTLLIAALAARLADTLVRQAMTLPEAPTARARTVEGSS